MASFLKCQIVANFYDFPYDYGHLQENTVNFEEIARKEV
jgi:hypothetical protein